MSQRKRHGEEEVKMSGSEYDLRVGNDLQAQAGLGGERRGEESPAQSLGALPPTKFPESLSSSYQFKASRTSLSSLPTNFTSP